MSEPTSTDTTNGAPIVEMASMAIESNGSGETAAASPPPPAFKDQFKAFCKFGDIKSDGKLISLSQSDKWMKQAKVIDKKITTTDTGIHFKKMKSVRVGILDYNKFLNDLAKTKKIELSEIKSKMANCGAPGVLHTTVSFFVFFFCIFINFQCLNSLEKQQQLSIA